jgi:hypothetical protein
MAAAAFLHNLIAAVPYRIHIVLNDNGIQVTAQHVVLRNIVDRTAQA